MNEQIMRELEAAARILLAPPHVVNQQQRQAATEVFSTFKRTNSPYMICRYILDQCKVDYVLFEVAEVLKEALIREWRLLQKADINSLLHYLLLYVSGRTAILPLYVREKIVQVIATAIKRGSIEDDGTQRGALLTEIENMIWSGDHQRQLLGCSLIGAIVQEHVVSSKSSEIGLTLKQNLEVKEQFEMTDLKKVFQFCVRGLSNLSDVEPPFTEQTQAVVKQLLTLSETVLTWNFTASTRLANTSNYETILYPKLKLPHTWKDAVLDNKVVNLYFTVYWKIRTIPTLGHHGLTCLVQFASLQGPIFESDESRYAYLTIFIEGFIKLVQNSDELSERLEEGIKGKFLLRWDLKVTLLKIIGICSCLSPASTAIMDSEAIGISNIAREIMSFLPDVLLPGLQPELLQCFMEQLTLLTCTFVEGAANEENLHADDRLYMEAFDHMMESWLNALTVPAENWKRVFKNATIRIFNAYLSSHLSPPEGSRNDAKDGVVEEYEDTDEPDRVKFRDQLQNVGEFGRHCPEHALPLLASLLESRTKVLAHCGKRLGMERSLSIFDSSQLFPVYEDLNWLMLIAGSVISYGTTEIPMDLMKYSVAKTPSTCIDTTLQVFGSPEKEIPEIPNAELCTDHVVRVIAGVFRLAALFKKFVENKMAMFLSPEMICSTLWFLKRWATTFLMFNEQISTELSMPFVCAFGRDSDGGVWALNFLLDLTIVLLMNLNTEPDVVQEAVDLFLALVDNKEKGQYVLKSENLKLLVMMLPNLRFKIKREVVRGLTLAGVALEDPSPDNEYWVQILKPIREKLESLMSKDDFQRNYHSEVVKAEVLDVLDCLIGVAMGSSSSTIPTIFRYLSPVMIVMPELMHTYHNYQQVVELILLALVKCATHFVSYLPHAHSKNLYEASLFTIQEYSRLNARRLTLNSSFEEDCFTDLLLIMELLSNLFTKDIFDFSRSDVVEVVERPLVAADVCLIGLNLIMPLVKIELLRFPELSIQYYKLISYVCQFYPGKVLDLEEKMLHTVLRSIEFGLNASGEEVIPYCCDFIQFLAIHIYGAGADRQTNPILKPFLKLLMNMSLAHRVDDCYMSKASGALFALICCYEEDYGLLVQSALESQPEPAVKQLLIRAFKNLTENIPLKFNRQNQNSFRKNFEVFAVEVRGFFMG